jgi:hypothetical protein
MHFYPNRVRKHTHTFSSATSFVNIGLTGEANFQFFGNPVGRLPGSFAVDSNGCYWASNIQMEGFVPGGYGRCDRIGCGMTKRNGRWHILFTKNGQLIGESFCRNIIFILMKFGCQ